MCWWECEPSAQGKQDVAYAAWRDGTAALDVDETQQIGFRVAKATGLDGVTCFDEGNVHWNGEPLCEYVGAHAPAQKAAMDTVFESLSARTTREQTTLPLPELLRLTNDPARDLENNDLSLFTNAVDVGGGFVGADASASWWRRNFRMFANVQKAAAPGHRVLVIAGAGHTAILKDLLAIDGARATGNVAGYLSP